MNWVYLSPHFDDVALSCGGLVWEQSQSGEAVSMWTICAGEPPPGDLSQFARELHTRWKAGRNATAQRRMEDINSCRLLGASYLYFTIPDCIYRRDPQTGDFMYASEEALNGSLQPGDMHYIDALVHEIKQTLPDEVSLVCPLGLGSHVDHQLTRRAAEGSGCRLWYYADYPYVLRWPSQLEQMEQYGWSDQLFPISQDGLMVWQGSIAAHGSQISTFWADEAEMRLAIRLYWQQNNGLSLWRKDETG